MIGAHEAGEDGGIEAAVAMGNERPGNAEDPGIGPEGAVGQFGQLTVIAGRQAGADFANLLGDDMGVVDQPLGGRCDRALVPDRLRDVAIGGAQAHIVIAKAGLQTAAGAALGRDCLGFGEAVRMLLQPLHAEDFRTDQVLAILIGRR